MSFSKKAGELLFAGICYDTGIFQYSRTTSSTFRVASELCKLGVKTEKIVEILRQRKSEAEQRMPGEVLANFISEFKGKIAYSMLKQEQYETAEKLGIEYGVFCDNLLNIHTVECALLFKEKSESFVKVNLRSKKYFNS